MKCSKCGNELKEGAKFCGYCGNKYRNTKWSVEFLLCLFLGIFGIHRLYARKS